MKLASPGVTLPRYMACKELKVASIGIANPISASIDPVTVKLVKVPSVVIRFVKVTSAAEIWPLVPATYKSPSISTSSSTSKSSVPSM